MSSRDAKKYYPFYSRIEVKAKVPYEFGTWMALWLRHRMGASKFEIDLLEFSLTMIIRIGQTGKSILINMRVRKCYINLFMD